MSPAVGESGQAVHCFSEKKHKEEGGTHLGISLGGQAVHNPVSVERAGLALAFQK